MAEQKDESSREACHLHWLSSLALIYSPRSEREFTGVAGWKRQLKGRKKKSMGKKNQCESCKSYTN